jgi:hypothetical protein
MTKLIIIVPNDQDALKSRTAVNDSTEMLPWIGSAKKEIIEIEGFPKWFEEFQLDPTVTRFYVEKLNE